MPYCEKCGFKLPEGAGFCPNCGAIIKKGEEISESPNVSLAKYLQLGLLGALLSVTISYFFSEAQLYFIPSFISSLAIIYLYRVGKLKDALITAMIVYLFEEAILSALFFGSVYASNTSLAYVYADYGVPTLVDVIMYVASPITSIIAGYVGASLVPKKKEPSHGQYGGRNEREPGGIVYNVRRDAEEIFATPLS